MKILFSQTYYLPYISGLTIYTQRIAKGLAERGYQTTVLTSQHDTHLPKEEWKNEGKIIRVPVLFKFHKWVFMHFWPIESFRQVRKTDVLICNLPQFESFIPALFAKLLRKKVLVIYTCDVILPRGLLNWTAEKALFLGNFLSAKLADKVITNTNDYANHSPFLLHFKDKTEAVFPPIILKPPSKAVGQRVKEKIGNGSFLKIGFAGRISAEKGIEYLLQAIPEVKSKIKNAMPASRQEKLKIIIAGPQSEVVGEGKYLKKLEPLIKRYSQYLIFLGGLNREEMAAFYKNIDLLVLPSINSTEAFGLVQVEAMLAGTPVVASNLPGVRVPAQKTGMGELVPIKSPEAVAEAVIKIYKNRQKYIKPKEEIEKIFSFKKTLNVYEKLIGSSF